MEPNVEYGESQVETTIVSSNYATIEQLVQMGTDIYNEIKQYCKTHKFDDTEIEDYDKKVPITINETDSDEVKKISKLNLLISRLDKTKELKRKPKVKKSPEEIPIDDKDEYRKVVKELQTKYKDFNASFPIFIRWTVQTLDFDAGALREFLRKHAQSKLRTMEDFLELQTKYVVYLYKAKHPHWNTNTVADLGVRLMTALIKEEKEFKDVSKEVEAEMKEDEKMRREHIKDVLRAIYKEKKENEKVDK